MKEVPSSTKRVQGSKNESLEESRRTVPGPSTIPKVAKPKRVTIEEVSDDEEEISIRGRSPESNRRDEDDDIPFSSINKERYLLPNKAPASESKREKSLQKRSSQNRAMPDIDAVANRVLDAPIDIRVRELMDMASQLRSRVKRLITPSRLRPEHISAVESALGGIFEDVDLDDEEPENTEVAEIPSLEFKLDAADWSKLPKFRVLAQTEKTLQKGTIVASDPFLTYLESLPEGTDPKAVVVARESESLRALHPFINGRDHKEAVLDEGSQIVSMSESIARDLGLAWDPDIVIYVEGVNAGVEKSLGLARNVPFAFEGVVAYLQVHVIKHTSYDILLGRPFHTVTSMTTDNDEKGGSLVTLTDPNSKKRVSLPTAERRAKRAVKKPPTSSNIQGFPISRN